MSQASIEPPGPGSAGLSYGQIFRATFFTGGASIITIALGIVRTKCMALLVGPSGVGLLVTYNTIIGFASTVAEMGISNSGVRHIADAAGSGDVRRIARTARTLRWTATALGFVGWLVLAALSQRASVLTFGNGSHAAAIAALGLTVFFGVMAIGNAAFIQGLRRVRDLARLRMFEALAGTAFGLPLIWWLHERGIVPLLVVASATSWFVTLWVARRVLTESVTVTWAETVAGSRSLLALGSVFMGMSVVGSGAIYVESIMIVRQVGLNAAGHYAAAYSLAGVYTGFVLAAMGTDLLPRLRMEIKNHRNVNQLVNEQTEIGLLLGVPGILATLVFAPGAIRLFYAAGFDGAVEVLRWQVLGIMGRVISWPMASLMVANGHGPTCLGLQIVSDLVHLLLVWIGLQQFGVVGAGMAFAGWYVFHAILLRRVAGAMTGFKWSAVNVSLLSWMLPLVVAVFLVMNFLKSNWSWVFGGAATVLGGWYCSKGLLRRFPAEYFAKVPFLRRWL